MPSLRANVAICVQRAGVAGWTALMIAGCSTTPTAHTHGPLTPGTAKITIGGHDAETTDNVQCSQVASLTTIAIGNDQTYAQVQISNASDLTVESVRIKGYGGFDGSYNHKLGGLARVTVAGSTYHISGTADGFDAANHYQVHSDDFTISFAC